MVIWSSISTNLKYMEIKDFIAPIIYMLPLLTLVWKGATLASRLANLETTVKEKIEKFCSDHKEMQRQIEAERKETDRDISAVLKTLNEIQKSIVRIETTLKIEDK